MLTWAGVILAVLQTINTLMQYVNSENARQTGIDAEIARTTLAILTKVRTRDQILEQVHALSDTDLDAGLRDLEPK